MRDVISELREAAHHEESEFTPDAKPGYRAFNLMSIELETAEFLYALVRAMKPAVVLESGSGHGYATLAIAGALERNQFGYLWTYEPDPKYIAETECRVGDMPHVSVVQGDSRDHPDEASMVFLDSGPATRVQEIKYWLYRPAALVIHDAYRYVETLKKMGGQMIPTPRGLWVRVSDWSTIYGPIQRDENDRAAAGPAAAPEA